MQKAEESYILALLVDSIPFAWAGTIPTLRRLRSLGWKPFWVLLFFVPMVKLTFFAVLCILHSHSATSSSSKNGIGWVHRFGSVLPSGKWGSAFLAVIIMTAITVLAAWTGIAAFKDYGWTIFVGLPICVGFLSALIDSSHEERSVRGCLTVANCSVLLAGAGLILFALGGVICLIMAAPLAFAVASIGGVLGYAAQKSFHWRAESPELFCSVIVLLRLAMGLQKAIPPSLPLLSVKTSVIVNAPPEEVWRDVVSFSELPPPKEMIFKLGIAYPIQAEIQGCGFGAVRHCNFSIGPFDDPIEVWDEPRLLKFSVTKNPEPMQEWTPYRDLHPAHLDGYLKSCAGQFLFTQLEGGRTLLEGSTWYHHHLWRANYWQAWSDRIIHTIHKRVINHAKNFSEKTE